MSKAHPSSSFSRPHATLSAALLAAGLLSAVSIHAWELPKTVFNKPAGKQAVQATATQSTSAAAGPIAPLPPAALPNYRAIIQQFGPAVVGINVEGTRNASNNGDDEQGDDEQEPNQGPEGYPFNPNDPFFRFFRGVPGFGFPPPQGNIPFKGQGSGFIISADGLILTNAHVVRDAKEVTVKLNDRREYRAKVLGADPDTDIAVLKIDGKNLPVVKVGNPQTAQVGDYVLAIGSPFGFEQTATQGIVSAKGRSLPGDAFVPFIQTDAAVNPGNSGGPLFDANGSVIGINAQIYSRSGGYQGLAFAIPIDVALKVKDQIVATGRASHARLGVQIQDLNQSLAESFGLARPDGALVAAISANSAAAAAGLKPGDVIVEVNGQAISRAGDLSSRIGLSQPGERITLKIWRDRSFKELQAKLGSARESKEAKAEAAQTKRGQLGLALRPLNREELSLARVDQGLLVQSVSGAAAKAGVQAGDVVLAINGKPVSNIEQIGEVLEKKPKSVALLIQRRGEQIFVPVNLN